MGNSGLCRLGSEVEVEVEGNILLLRESSC